MSGKCALCGSSYGSVIYFNGIDRHSSNVFCVSALQQENAKLRDLLIAFGKADLALEEHDDGIGCDDLITVHAESYKAIKDEARRLAKEGGDDE